jgi:uncharacterized protein YabN with tetrapyrrole methylase and pyrophosphatase domain
VKGPSLTVVGLGINIPAHVTAETRMCLERAGEVLYLVADPVAVSWIESVNPRARPLHVFYEPGKNRSETYAAIVEEILARLRLVGNVCVAFYGHPGVFVNPSHEAIRRARGEGFQAQMLAAVSAQDCLFSDLGVDPSESGCQSYEATDLLIYAREIDPSAALIVWQVGVVGNLDYAPYGDRSCVPVLVEYLERYYPSDHEVVCYEASLYPVCGAFVQRVPLSKLAEAEISPMSTLYVPPALRRERDAAMVTRLAQTRDAKAPAVVRA